MNSKLEVHKSLTLPREAYSDALVDWMDDLAELDAYYVGGVESVIRFAAPVNLDLSRIESLEVDLKVIEVSEGDDRYFKECVCYLRSLRGLIEAVLANGAKNEGET